MMGFGFVVARFGLFLREIAAAGHVPADHRSTAWSLGIGIGLIALGVVVTLTASFEHLRFVQQSSRGQSYTPRTAMLAIGVAVMLGILGILMAAYLILVSV